MSMEQEGSDPFRQWAPGSTQTVRRAGIKASCGKGKRQSKGKGKRESPSKPAQQLGKCTGTIPSGPGPCTSESDGSASLAPRTAAASCATGHEGALLLSTRSSALHALFDDSGREKMEGACGCQPVEVLPSGNHATRTSPPRTFPPHAEMQAQACKMNWVDSQGAWNYLGTRESDRRAGSQNGKKDYGIHSAGSGGCRESDQRDVDSRLRLGSPVSSTLRDKLGTVKRVANGRGSALEALQALINCSVIHLSARFRRDRPVTSGLAQSLQNSDSEKISLLGLDLTQVQLSNPTSCACYMNSVLLAILHTLQCLRPAHEDALGQLRGIHPALCRHRGAFDISKHMPWVLLISPWPRPFQQHDAAEFASCRSGSLASSAF